MENLERQIIITADGSTSLQITAWQEQYHSLYGAIQEAELVYIKNGLELFQNQEISILEIGFGTGLNTFLTFLHSKKLNQKIYYETFEAFPLSTEEIKALNYTKVLNVEKEDLEIFNQIHHSSWEENEKISSNFILKKRKDFFQNISFENQFDLIYFDAFGYRVQPELWSQEIFEKMYKALKKDGVLVTYSSKGIVRRTMLSVGFSVEKLPGPKGKREMLRAKK